MDAILGTLILAVFCLTFFEPSQTSEKFRTNEVVQKVEINFRANEHCQLRIKNLYASYDLEEPTKKTLKMLCENKE